MRPVPETRDALHRMAEDGETAAVDALEVAVQRTEDLVPGLAAYSLTLVARSLTLTYVTTQRAAPADSEAGRAQTQGPDEPDPTGRPAAQASGAVLAGPLDESRWQNEAQAEAAPGILSTLSIPIVAGDVVIGSVTLYGSRPDTFEGRHRELVELVGASSPGAVSNADLRFASRSDAARAPQVLDDERTIEAAVACLVVTRRVSPELARRKLHEVAAEANLPVVALALMVLEDDDPYSPG